MFRRLTTLKFRAEDGVATPAPGTGETQPGANGSSAGTENADTASGRQSETIPYSRFKEVNDQLSELRPFKELVELGYDADSLRQLAEFEVNFAKNPTQEWLRIADKLQDLPPAVREAIKNELQGSQNGPAGGSTPAVQQNANDETTDEREARLRRLEEREAAREEASRQAQQDQLLQSVLDKWTEADKQDNLKPLSEERMLTFIMAHSGSAKSLDELLEVARGEYLDLRNEALQSSVKRENTTPRSVPGSGVETPAPRKPKTLADARAAIEADVKTGRLKWE